jgi:hypothetical protein
MEFHQQKQDSMVAMVKSCGTRADRLAPLGYAATTKAKGTTVRAKLAETMILIIHCTPPLRDALILSGVESVPVPASRDVARTQHRTQAVDHHKMKGVKARMPGAPS